MTSVGGWAAWCPLVQPGPFMSSRRHFCPSLWHIVLLWFILYPSTSLPFPPFLSHPFRPPRRSCSLFICFLHRLSEGHGCARTHTCVEIDPVSLFWGVLPCWGIREGAMGGSKDGGHGRVRKRKDECYASQMGAGVMMEHSESAISSPMHQHRHHQCWLANLPHIPGKVKVIRLSRREFRHFSTASEGAAGPLRLLPGASFLFFFLTEHKCISALR